jgi:CheY-like chemotaxis protein
MRALFATLGADFAGAATAAGLLDELGRHGRYPDLVVADLRLDAMACGLDAIAHLRDELGLPVPALIVSGDTSVAAARLVRAAGLPLLYKPADPLELESAAARLIAARHCTP